MPKVNFPEVPDVQNFSPLPEGKYLCKLIEITESTTQYDDEMWKLRFKVIEGQYKGRIILDNLVFSEAALKRVKLICSRLGLDTTQEIDVTPGMLLKHKCYIDVEIQDYANEKGEPRKRNKVAFAGYELFEGEEESQEEENVEEIEEEEDLPF